jgi:hypothetical protein
MQPLPCSEPFLVPEPFVTHVCRVELVGPCCRAVFGVQQTASDGTHELVINARVILTPECAVQLARHLLATVETRPEPVTFQPTAYPVN